MMLNPAIIYCLKAALSLAELGDLSRPGHGCVLRWRCFATSLLATGSRPNRDALV